jgi:signal transduction histidine kinase
LQKFQIPPDTSNGTPASTDDNEAPGRHTRLSIYRRAFGNRGSDILALARGEQQSVAESAPVDLAEIVFDVAQEMYPVARARNVRFSVDVPHETMVMADPRSITRALRAILHNAVSHAGTLVTISATAGREHVRLTVADDGEGFSQEALVHAKDRLWKGDTARRRGSGGAGLGLAIADAIVTGWGGSLRVANGDTGANVELAIPLASTSPLSSQS